MFGNVKLKLCFVTVRICVSWCWFERKVCNIYECCLFVTKKYHWFCCCCYSECDTELWLCGYRFYLLVVMPLSTTLNKHQADFCYLFVIVQYRLTKKIVVILFFGLFHVSGLRFQLRWMCLVQFKKNKLCVDYGDRCVCLGMYILCSLLYHTKFTGIWGLKSHKNVAWEVCCVMGKNVFLEQLINGEVL